MPTSSTELATAIECFARGFAFTRCFTHPCGAELVGKLWRIRDEPRKRAADYRHEEWVAYDVEPTEVHATARSRSRGGYSVCAIVAAGESEASVRAGYKALNYRLNKTEPLMLHRLSRVAKWPVPIPIERVLSQELADRVGKASGRRQILPEDLQADAPLRLYTALDGNQPAGWLKSITVGDHTWVSNVYVQPGYRRRGIGKSLLAKMLRDDRKHGSQASILLASHTGALLYESVGYKRLGTLLLFTPKR